MSPGEKGLFFVGGGLLLAGIAYAYLTAKKTVESGIQNLTTAGGLIPTPADLARTGGQAAGYVVDAAGNVVQAGSTVFGTAFDLWKTGINYAGQAAGVGEIFPGDLGRSGDQAGGYWDAEGYWIGDPYATGTLPRPTPYAGPVGTDHALDEYIRTGTMSQAMTSLYDIVIWTVGRHFRGETWDSADWSNIQSYFQSGYAVQDPYLYEYAVLATEQQQAAIAPQTGGSDEWTSG